MAQRPLTALASARLALSWALRPWLAVHGIAFCSAAAVLAKNGGHFPTAGSAPSARGAFAWDGGWYRAISADGYGQLEPEAVRFFPLFPLLGRWLSWVASVCALLYLATTAALASALLRTDDAGRRAAWAAALFPGASAIALPYTEALAGLLVASLFLALRRDRIALAFWAGLLSGLTRPTGALLALPALVGALSRGSALRGIAAATGPPLGAAIFLLATLMASGDFLAPYTAQSDDSLRGGFLINPIPGVLADKDGGIGPPATLALMAIGVVLAVRVFQRLPVEYGVWSAAMLALAAGSAEAHSLPRYVAGIVPFMIVLPTLFRSNRAWRTFLFAAAGASMLLTAHWLDAAVVP